MGSLIFRGAYFRHAVTQDDESGVFVRAHITADLSTPVCEEMGWTIGEGGVGGDLKGRLEGTALIMTPNDSKLQGHELQVICSEVADFKWKECKEKGGNSTHMELRFIVRLPGEGAAAFVENYKRRVGKEQSQLKIDYNANHQEELGLNDGDEDEEENEVEDAQEELELGEDTHEDPSGKVVRDDGCVACNNDIPLNDPFDGKHESGAKCTNPESDVAGEAPLASARAAVGGTHQRGTRGRRAPRDHKREAIADGTALLDDEAAAANGFAEVPVKEEVGA